MKREQLVICTLPPFTFRPTPGEPTTLQPSCSPGVVTGLKIRVRSTRAPMLLDPLGR